MDFLRSTKEIYIDDDNYEEYVEAPIIDGHRMSMGLVPRNYGTHPVGSLGAPAWSPKEIKLIPREEWSSRIKDKIAEKSCLSDIRLAGDGGKHIPSLDQNGQGYCWAYSTVAGVQINRAVANEPYVPLSAHSVGCVVKNFRDEGGWGGLSMQFIIEKGVVPQSLWPAKSMSRSYNTEENWKEAAKYKITSGWCDLTIAPYDRDLTLDQEMSCLLQNIPVVSDFYWWGHSVLSLDALEIDPSLRLSDTKRWGKRILNSWKDSWSDLGMAVLIGDKAVTNGAVASRVVLAA